jgi:hypothetical protein
MDQKNEPEPETEFFFARPLKNSLKKKTKKSMKAHLSYGSSIRSSSEVKLFSQQPNRKSRRPVG